MTELPDLGWNGMDSYRHVLRLLCSNVMVHHTVLLITSLICLFFSLALDSSSGILYCYNSRPFVNGQCFIYHL